jgi:hypothetical protein
MGGVIVARCSRSRLKESRTKVFIRMGDGDLRDQISSLEAHIDELTGVIESCRKLILVSKVAIAAGGIWLLAFTFGAIRFESMAMVGAIAAVIGGTVVFGSNTSTSKQAAADIKAAEALRAELIDKINLQLVGEAQG